MILGWKRRFALAAMMVLSISVSSCASLHDGYQDPKISITASLCVVDPTGEGIRAAGFSLFGTLSPRIRIQIPEGADSKTVRVILDGGYDDVKDWLDLSSKCRYSGTRAEIDIPFVAGTDYCNGEGKPNRHYNHSMCVVYPGQNRIRVYVGETLAAEATFLCYDAAHKTICSRRTSPTRHPRNELEIGANQIVLNFPEDRASDAAISSFLSQQRLHPVGLIRDINCITVEVDPPLTTGQLLARIERLSMLLGSPGAARCNWLTVSDMR